jgi:hypothetical protein
LLLTGGTSHGALFYLGAKQKIQQATEAPSRTEVL